LYPAAQGKLGLNFIKCNMLFNIKMDLREIGWVGMDWIDVGQDRDRWRFLVKKVINLRVR
jgi:hypothetical protein